MKTTCWDKTTMTSLTPFVPAALSMYTRITLWGNYTMMIACMLLIITIIACYGYYDHLTINQQISGHILMLIAATAIKFGYIARCIGRQGLGIKQL